MNAHFLEAKRLLDAWVEERNTRHIPLTEVHAAWDAFLRTATWVELSFDRIFLSDRHVCNILEYLNDKRSKARSPHPLHEALLHDLIPAFKAAQRALLLGGGVPPDQQVRFLTTMDPQEDDALVPHMGELTPEAKTFVYDRLHLLLWYPTETKMAKTIQRMGLLEEREGRLNPFQTKRRGRTLLEHYDDVGGEAKAILQRVADQQRQTAVAMGQHARLGAASPLYALTGDIVHYINNKHP